MKICSYSDERKEYVCGARLFYLYSSWDDVSYLRHVKILSAVPKRRARTTTHCSEIGLVTGPLHSTEPAIPLSLTLRK